MNANHHSSVAIMVVVFSMLCTGEATHASQYRVTFSANSIVIAGTTFGVSTGNILTTSGEMVIESANVTVVPAGTILPGGVTFTTDLTFIPRSAVVSWTVSSGNQVFTDLFELGDFYTTSVSVIVLSANLTTATSGSNIRLVVGNNDAALQFGRENCVSNVCTVGQFGELLDFTASILGEAAGSSNMVVTIESLTKTAAEQLTDLEAQVKSINLKQGLSNAADKKLENARKALDETTDNDKSSAINMLNAFINWVEAQREKEITTAQADSLVTDANKIINTLQGGN